MSLALFIAKKLRAHGVSDERVSRPVIRIAAAGVALGLAVMIVSVSVVVGFKHTISNLVESFAGQIQVADFTTMQTTDTRPIEIADSMMSRLKQIKGVGRVQRFANKEGILKTDNDFLGIIMKGVGAEFDTTFIASRVIEGHLPHFDAAGESNNIAISKTIADKLHLTAGSKVYAYFVDNDNVRMRRLYVSGIYQTNLAMYDNTICLASLATVVKLNGWDEGMVTGAELWTDGTKSLSDVEDQMVRQVNRTHDAHGNTFTSKNIRDICPQIFSWLDLLDLNVWIILAIMSVVSAVTMISGILIIILERASMIGTLKALGARNGVVRRTFLLYASFIIGKGLLWGNVLGVGIVILQRATGLVKLDPTIYYVDYVPVELNLVFLLGLNIATLIVCMLAILAPSYIVATINPARSMRYE